MKLNSGKIPDYVFEKKAKVEKVAQELLPNEKGLNQVPGDIKRYCVYRDGELKFCGTDAECMRWIHDHTPFSVDHAIKYEGYSVSPKDTVE